MAILAYELEGVAGGHWSFLFDGKIKAAATAAQEPLQDIVALKLGGQFVAWDSRLTDHHRGRTDLQTVANMERVFAETAGREILTEHPPRQIHPRQFLLPIGIVFRRIGVNSLVRAPMDAHIRLAITFQI